MTIGHDHTGRSRVRKRGRLSSLFDGDSFIALPISLCRSVAWRRLNSPARHFIDFLILEHLLHGGAENGRLLAPYAQLERFGISARDVSVAVEMAVAFGVVIRTKEGARLGGRRGAATYALAWLPCADGSGPCNAYKKVTAQWVDQYYADLKRQRWLKQARKSQTPPQI